MEDRRAACLLTHMRRPRKNWNRPSAGVALQLCREILVPCHDSAAGRAAESGRRRATLALWSAASGAAAVILSIVALALSAAGKMPAGAARPLEIVQAAAAAACFLLLGARALAGRRSAWIADLARVERCRTAKFRFLLDPSLWSRRGQEAQERTAALRAEAEDIAAFGPSGAAEWASADTIGGPRFGRQASIRTPSTR